MRDVRARAVGREDPDPDGNDEPVRGEERRDRKAGAAQVAPPTRFARAPEKPHGEREQEQAGRKEGEPCPVLAPCPNRLCVGDRDGCAFESKDPERTRQRRAYARAGSGKRRCCRGEDDQRPRRAQQMVSRRGARLGRDE